MTPAEIWVSIIKMPRPHQLVDFPRMNAQGEPVARISMTVLTQEEQITASLDTDRFTKRVMKEMPRADEAKRCYDDIYNNRAALEILHRACRSVENFAMPFFPSPNEMATHLTPDEVGVLFRSYLLVQDDVGPIISRLSQEEVEAWIKRLREAGSKAPLALLSLGALSDLAYSMACLSENFATDTTSPGSLLEKPTSTQPDDVTPAVDAVEPQLPLALTTTPSTE